MRFFANIIEGLNELHKRDYLHRDIIPNNFLIFTQADEKFLKLASLYKSSKEKDDPPFYETMRRLTPEEMSY